MTFPWTLFMILTIAGLFGGIAILPYALALNPQALEKLRESQAGKAKPISPALIVILSGTIQTGVLVALTTAIGLLAAQSVGLKLPVLQALIAGQPALDLIVAILPAVLITGVTTALALFYLERYVFLPNLPAAFSQVSKGISVWKRALTPFYGGIVEEILLRLFMLSGLAWLIGLVWKTDAGVPAMGAFWLANFLSSLLFGLGHLPATRAISPLTPLVITRALVMNGLAGLVFGFLFINYGLEAAMLAHFCLDIVLHLIIPAFPAPRTNAQAQPVVH